MDWLGDNLWAMWLGIAALLLVGEMLSLDLVMLMMSAGAGVAAVSWFWIDQWQWQLVLGAGVSVACLLLIRPGLLRRLHTGPELLVGPERMVGLTLTSPVALSSETPAQVKIDGEWWSTRLVAGAAGTAPGTLVEVVRISGATAYVAPFTPHQEKE
jgi:membrane protein implicated in regulation of membrane protease activity